MVAGAAVVSRSKQLGEEQGSRGCLCIGECGRECDERKNTWNSVRLFWCGSWMIPVVSLEVFRWSGFARRYE